MTATSATRARQERPRALRLARQTQLQYRSPRDHHWHAGIALNMSMTGMLIATHDKLRIHHSVKLRVAVPPELSGPASPVLTINCIVVRQHEPHQFGVRFDNAAAATTAVNDRAISAHTPFHSLMHDLAVIVGHCDLLQCLTTSEPKAATAVQQIKKAAMNATATLRRGIA